MPLKHASIDQALDECHTKVEELQKKLAEEHQRRKEMEGKMKVLEQKQTKESKPPTKEHKGSASVSHPPHSKSLQQERGETDAQALQRVRQNREDLRDQVEELKKSNAELLAKEKDLKKSIDILQERNQQLCKNPVASQACVN